MNGDSMKKFDALVEGLSRSEIKKLVMAYVLAGSVDYITLTDIVIETISDDGALKLGKTKEIYLGVRLTDDSPLQYLKFNKVTDKRWTTKQSLRWYGCDKVDVVVRAGGTGGIESIKIPSETLLRWWRVTKPKTRLVQYCRVDGLGYQLRLSFGLMVTFTYKLKVYVFMISVVYLSKAIHMRLYDRRRLLKDLKAAISQQVLLKYLLHSVSTCSPLASDILIAYYVLVCVAHALRDLHQYHFVHTGDLSDVTKGITALEPFLADTNSFTYCALGGDYLDLYQRTHVEADGEKAGLYLRKACRLSPDDFTSVHLLAKVLCMSLDLTGKPIYLEEVSIIARRCMTLARGPREMAFANDTLGFYLAHHFGLTPSRLDLIDEAISCLRTAVTLSDNDMFAKRTRLLNLILALKNRFQCTARPVDVEEAISLIQSGIRLAQTGLPVDADGAKFMATLHHELIMLKGVSYQWAAIDRLSDGEAILAGRKAIELSTAGDVDLPDHLNHLGIHLTLRFQQLHTVDDIKEAIYVQKRALDLTPKNHREFRNRNKSFSSSYWILARVSQDPDAFDQFIAFGQASVNGIDKSHQEYADLMHVFAIAYLQRDKSDAHHQPQDLQFALDLLRQTIRGTHPSHPRLGMFFISFADALSRRSTADGDPSPMVECAELLEKVACSRMLIANLRTLACTKWIEAVGIPGGGMKDTVTLTRAFNKLLELLAVTVGLEHTMELHHKLVESLNSGFLIANAVTVGMVMGRTNQALEWLEQGRCLVWNQLNSLRTPLDDLWDHDQSLAHRVLTVSRALENAGGRESAASFDTPFPQKISDQNAILRHARLGKEWEELLQTVRSTPGFDRFLMPPSCSDLFSHLPEGGHVIIIVGNFGYCHAIVLQRGYDNASAIHLPNFSEYQAARLSEELDTNLALSGLRHRSASHSESEGTQLERSDDENRSVRRFGRRKSAEDVFKTFFVSCGRTS